MRSRQPVVAVTINREVLATVTLTTSSYLILLVILYWVVALPFPNTTLLILYS